MTIKEIYEWAKKNKLEDYELILNTSTGESDSCYSTGDLIIDDTLKEITF